MTQPGDPNAPTEEGLAADLSAEPVLEFATGQPDPAPPDTALGRREAAAQLRQAHNDSYPSDGTEPADGTADPYRPGPGDGLTGAWVAP